MIFLAGFAPFQPSPGLALWSLIIFILFWLLMAKYAFKPMMDGLKKRESSISDALAQAQTAREEMANLKAENEKILAEAREERAKMIKEAKDTSTSIVNDAKNKAKDEAQRIMTSAKLEIENDRNSALTQVKNQVGMMATNIAEKILKKELAGGAEHTTYVNKLVDEINLN